MCSKTRSFFKKEERRNKNESYVIKKRNKCRNEGRKKTKRLDRETGRLVNLWVWKTREPELQTDKKTVDVANTRQKMYEINGETDSSNKQKSQKKKKQMTLHY